MGKGKSIRPLNSGEKVGGDRRKRVGAAKKAGHVGEENSSTGPRTMGGWRVLEEGRRVRERGNKGIELGSAGVAVHELGRGRAWRGPCAECVVQEVRTPTEGGGCCNGFAHGRSRGMHGGTVHGTTWASTCGAANGGRCIRGAHSEGEGNLW